MTRLLFIGGHDPTGGAGLHADIETCADWGMRSASLLSACTVQSTARVARVEAGDLRLAEQAEAALREEFDFAAVKTGLLPTAGWVHFVAEIVGRLTSPSAPLIVDPVLASGGEVSSQLVEEEVLAAYSSALFPLCFLATPNRSELRQLSGVKDLHEGAQALRSQGCRWVLVTGADEPIAGSVENWLFGPDGYVLSLPQPHLPGRYHGSGCTLASAAACAIASIYREGKSEIATEVASAVQKALDYCQQCLERATRPELATPSSATLPNRTADPDLRVCL